MRKKKFFYLNPKAYFVQKRIGKSTFFMLIDRLEPDALIPHWRKRQILHHNSIKKQNSNYRNIKKHIFNQIYHAFRVLNYSNCSSPFLAATCHHGA